ncbi:hypothetical protein [Bacillus mycoides]|uniref:hypothetical protein n=1 Tax=Bacillus mycoides TaxID=1405 RepID=UPI001C02DC8B|nr:hypothetical protein [Bacillus mycoides]QWI48380.1 hypothetical protein EXW56_05355 [Bacillus mycoides]
MKKFITIGLVVGLLTGCVSVENVDDTKDTTQQNQKAETTSEKTTDYPFPKETNSVGKGKLIITTSEGNSKDGKVPVEFMTKDIFLAQLGIELAKFQEDKQVFIYIDKKFHSEEQIEELKESGVTSDGFVETNLALSEDQLKPGIHTVTAVQFENDDPNGKVSNFTEAKFEIKERK